MSDEDPRLTPDGCGADAAAYALGALEAGEAKAFERHLEGCSACAEDIVAFQHVADALAMSPPQYVVPSRLRRRVMAGLRSEPSPHTAGRRRGFWVRLLMPTGVRLVVPVVALGLAVVVASVILLSGGSRGVRVLNARVIDSPGTAQVRLAGGRAELSVRHFPPPAAGQVYEVWLKRPGRALTPTRVLFSVTARGAGDIGVPAPLRGVSEILVTSEPAGGSLVPTHRSVIIAPLG